MNITYLVNECLFCGNEPESGRSIKNLPFLLVYKRACDILDVVNDIHLDFTVLYVFALDYTYSCIGMACKQITVRKRSYQ